MQNGRAESAFCDTFRASSVEDAGVLFSWWDSFPFTYRKCICPQEPGTDCLSLCNVYLVHKHLFLFPIQMCAYSHSHSNVCTSSHELISYSSTSIPIPHAAHYKVPCVHDTHSHSPCSPLKITSHAFTTRFPFPVQHIESTMPSPCIHDTHSHSPCSGCMCTSSTSAMWSINCISLWTCVQ